MSRQGRLTLLCATGVSILVALALVLAGGNTAVRAGDPSTERAPGEVIETGATATTLVADGIAVPAEQADDPDQGGFLLPEGIGVDQPEALVTTTVDSGAATPSTSSTTTTSTTTTVPPPVIDDGSGRSVLLQEGWMVLGGGDDDPATIEIGTDAGATVDAVVAALGNPTSDTGAMEDTECAGFTTRRLRFDGLEIVLSERVEGELSFEQWFVDGTTAGGIEIETEDQLRVGMPVGQLIAINSSIVVFEDEGSASFKMPDDTSNVPVWGRTTGDSPDDTVTALWSGNECRR